jgi:hypothetical protein
VASVGRLREEQNELRAVLAAVDRRMKAVEEAAGLAPPRQRPRWPPLAAGAACLALAGIGLTIFMAARPCKVPPTGVAVPAPLVPHVLGPHVLGPAAPRVAPNTSSTARPPAGDVSPPPTARF